MAIFRWASLPYPPLKEVCGVNLTNYALADGSNLYKALLPTCTFGSACFHFNFYFQLGLTVLVNDVDIIYLWNPMAHLFCVLCDLLMTADHYVEGKAVETYYNTGIKRNF